MFRVIERFISIDGEGPTSGELAAFIRFEGCNLRCTWCDTAIPGMVHAPTRNKAQRISITILKKAEHAM